MISPEVRASFDIDDSRGNANFTAGLLHAPIQDVTNGRPLPGLRRIDRLVQIHRPRVAQRDQKDALSRQFGCKAFRQARGQVRLLAAAAVSGKGKHSDRHTHITARCWHRRPRREHSDRQSR